MICYVFILTSFACNAKSFAIACLVFFFRFVLPCNAKKLAIAFLVVVFSPFLSWRVLERDWQKFFDQCFIICYLESVCPDSDLIVWHAIGFHSMFLADLSESMWNIAPSPTKSIISWQLQCLLSPKLPGRYITTRGSHHNVTRPFDHVVLRDKVTN